MRHFSNLEIQKIKQDLDNGKVYCGITENLYGIGYIYKFNRVIRWEHYGSSAIRNTIKEIRWLFEVIFEECITMTEAIWSDYHINYVPLSTEYKPIDHNMSHPNV